jgi:hypothetical protein
MRQLMEDEVQGDQEDGLHGEDGEADGDGLAPRHARHFAGATFEPALDGVVRVSVVATGVDQVSVANTDVETEPLSLPVIPFPEPIEWRGVRPPHRSLLERLKSPLRLAS